MALLARSEALEHPSPFRRAGWVVAMMAVVDAHDAHGSRYDRRRELTVKLSLSRSLSKRSAAAPRDRIVHARPG